MPNLQQATYRSTFSQRLIGSARLDPWVYRELEYDTPEFSQSFVVVVLSAASTWVGITGRFRPFRSLFLATDVGVLAWVFWAWLAFVIGVKLLPEPQTKATWGQLLRTTGFATGPGILAVLGIFPSLTGFAPFLTNIWILVAFVVAVRRALDYTETWRAVVVCLIGWAIYAAALWAVH